MHTKQVVSEAALYQTALCRVLSLPVLRSTATWSYTGCLKVATLCRFLSFLQYLICHSQHCCILSLVCVHLTFQPLPYSLQLLAAYSEHFGRLLPDSVQLYTAVKTAVEFAKSLRPTEDLPHNLQAIMQAILDGPKQKLELSNPQKVSAPYVTTSTATTPTLATPTCQPDTGTVQNGLM